MTDNLHRGAIVVGIDGSDHGQLALTRAIELARLEHRPLHLVHSYNPYPSTVAMTPQPADLTATFAEAATSVAKETLEAARLRAQAEAPAVDVTVDLTTADAREVLADASVIASVVVVGSRGLGTMRRLLLGSVSLWVTQHAESPVLVVRESPAPESTSILVGTDGTAASSAAVEFAFLQASTLGCSLTVVHCLPGRHEASHEFPAALDEELDNLADERRSLAEQVAGLREKYIDVPFEIELARGPAATYLVNASAKCRLLVVGSHQRSRMGVLLHGAVSRTVVEHALCDVAVVPSADKG